MSPTPDLACDRDCGDRFFAGAIVCRHGREFAASFSNIWDQLEAKQGDHRTMTNWQPIETCPPDGLFLVYEDGAMRMMYRSRGEWQATAVAVDQWGAGIVSDNVKVRETGVYNPTHWMPLPDPPPPPSEAG